MAELAFDADGCIYTEVRRAAYESQREAIGVLLSRALACGESALIDTVEQLNGYMTAALRRQPDLAPAHVLFSAGE